MLTLILFTHYSIEGTKLLGAYLHYVAEEPQK